MGDTLTEGQKLVKGGSLTSSNGAYTLTLQDDGNLVLAARGQAVWSTSTNGQDVVSAPRSRPTATSCCTPPTSRCGTPTPRARRTCKLVLQDDRNLVLYAADGPAWSSKTEHRRNRRRRRARAEPEVAPAAVEEPARRRAPAPAAPPPPPPPPAPRTYTVVSGDTLWAIAERFYGDGSKYQRIADASGVANPDLIHPGQVLTIPY